MKKYVKKWIGFLTLGAVTLSTVFSGNITGINTVEVAKAAVTMPEDTNDISTPDNPAVFRDLSSEEIIKEMGAGWNLGNTFDGLLTRNRHARPSAVQVVHIAPHIERDSLPARLVLDKHRISVMFHLRLHGYLLYTL